MQGHNFRNFHSYNRGQGQRSVGKNKRGYLLFRGNSSYHQNKRPRDLSNSTGFSDNKIAIGTEVKEDNRGSEVSTYLWEKSYKQKWYLGLLAGIMIDSLGSDTLVIMPKTALRRTPFRNVYYLDNHIGHHKRCSNPYEHDQEEVFTAMHQWWSLQFHPGEWRR